jgi:RimJ/RimL family protein N-acetyltransferase
MQSAAGEVRLRPVQADDMEPYFAMMADPEANWMAAFTPLQPADRTAFDARWARILANSTGLVRTVVLVGEHGEEVAGSILRYEEEGRNEVSYWIDRALWGRGIGSAALRLFLAEQTQRPLYARAAADNGASLRLLERAGFVRCGQERGYANARGQEIDEVVLVLEETRGLSEAGSE